MKKAFIVTLSIVLILLSAFSVCAESETYFISDLNLSIEVPSDYNVFARDMEENSFTLKKYGYTKEELLNLLEESNIYFDGFNNPASEEIVITASKIKISDIAIFEDDELEEMIDASIKNHEAKGAEVLDCSIYVNSKTTYIVTTLCDPTEGNAINYYTINNYDAINITCCTYENPLDSKKELFASIIDNITFYAYNGVTTLPDSDDNRDFTTLTTPVNDDNIKIYEKTFTLSIAENGKLTPLGESLILTGVIVLIQIIAGVVVLIILLNKRKKRRQNALTQNANINTKFCIYCGTELKQNDNFCYKCGKSQAHDENA